MPETTIRLRRDLINYFIGKFDYKSYLEIGLYKPDRTFNHVECETKHSIDPAPIQGAATYPMTSDEFFDNVIEPDAKYDIIFIDGDHSHLQVDKDVVNALKYLSANGTIIMHDLAYGEFTRTPLNPRGTTVWKSWVRLRCTRPDLEMNVINTDWGIGIIRRGSQEIWDEKDVDQCLEESYFTGLVDEEGENPLLNYNLLQGPGCCFLRRDDENNITFVDSTHSNLKRTHLLPFITIEQFHQIYN